MPSSERPFDPDAVTGSRRTCFTAMRRATCDRRVAGSTVIGSGVIHIPTPHSVDRPIGASDKPLPGRRPGEKSP